jgi:hypothetical protein
MGFQGGFGTGLFDDTDHRKDIVEAKKVEFVVTALGFKNNGPVQQFLYHHTGEPVPDYGFHNPLGSRNKGGIVNHRPGWPVAASMFFIRV